MRLTTWKCSSAIARAAVCNIVFLVLAGPAAQDSHAGLFTLVDDNASAHFNTTSQLNNDSWFVDGLNQLHSQAFWYRVGQGENVPEQSVHTTLNVALEGTTDSNFDGNPDTLFVRYLDPSGRFKIETTYGLVGGSFGSGTSDLTESIQITNTSALPLDFHFFQYADFDLRATPGGDTVSFTNGNTVRQIQGPGPLTVEETVFTPEPSHREVAAFPVTLNKLTNASSTTLSDTLGPIGPNNVTWANQWDFPNLPPNGTVIISKDKRIVGAVPEPASATMVALFAYLMLAAYRKRAVG